MNTLKSIFYSSAAMGVISFGLGCGLGYLSGDFNGSTIPIATVMSLGTIVGGCFGAMFAQNTKKPTPK